MDKLLAWDHDLFVAINQTWAVPSLDAVMALISDNTFWLVISFLIMLSRALRRDWDFLKACLLAGLALAVADQFAHQVLKPGVGRFRPCHFLDAVRLYKSCGGKFSFPSNHATNAMALMAIMGLQLGWRWGLGLFVVGLLVGYSRIVLGVHYPLDILGGFAFGAAVGVFAVYVARKLRPQWYKR